MSDKVFVSVGVDGRNVPAGGEAGQYLKKASNADYDFEWESPDSGGGGAEGTPAVIKSPKDTGDGLLGSGVAFARYDHAHPLNVPSVATNPQMDGTAAMGNSDYYAPLNHIHPSNNYPSGFAPVGNILLTSGVHYYPNAASLPAAGVAGRIAFVKA